KMEHKDGSVFQSGGRQRRVEVNVIEGPGPKRLVGLEMKFTTGDVISLSGEDQAGHFVKKVTGPSFQRPVPERTLLATLPDEAEALGQALNSRSDRPFFRRAAACAWRLLRQLPLRRNNPGRKWCGRRPTTWRPSRPTRSCGARKRPSRNAAVFIGHC